MPVCVDVSVLHTQHSKLNGMMRLSQGNLRLYKIKAKQSSKGNNYHELDESSSNACTIVFCRSKWFLYVIA